MITTATLRHATGWDTLVTDLGLPGLVRHGLQHTTLTWMADTVIELHILQRVAGHQDPARIWSVLLSPRHSPAHGQPRRDLARTRTTGSHGEHVARLAM
ncbi:hypothetical protein [Actinopolymorpha alba]|uniref:hypothetical protein n=1 Tax=Actinopolymorpha alba TaxID=533267 RepID=UPI0003A530DC|nr:hypothetical protein [Actinopolymorpha alba]